jgi:hypothetical protein
MQLPSVADAAFENMLQALSGKPVVSVLFQEMCKIFDADFFFENSAVLLKIKMILFEKLSIFASK